MSFTRSNGWTVYNAPVSGPVEYYAILDEKRKFLQLVKDYDSKAFKYGYSHYCSIVPSHSDQESSIKNLFIFFIDEFYDLSFIGFCINVNENAFLHEASSLILFLKHSMKAESFSIKNNQIHVKCKQSIAWELFYDLYDTYLRRDLVTKIGTLFFYSMFYSYFLIKEKLLLNFLYKGSKVVNVSKKSVFYKIHKKRKLSVTDILYTCHNMPSTKKYAFSCYRFKKPCSIDCLNKKSENTLTNSLAISNIGHSSKTDSSVFSVIGNLCDKEQNKIKKGQKRKFQEVSNSHQNSLSGINEHNFTNKATSHGKWSIYRSMNSSVFKSYSEIPQIKKMVPLLLKNQPKFQVSESLLKKSSNCPFDISMKREGAKKTPLVFKTTYLGENSSTEINSLKALSKETDEELREVHLPCQESNVYSCMENYSINSIMKETDEKDFSSKNDHVTLLSDCNFLTASGENLSLTNASILAAQNMMNDILSGNEVVPVGKCVEASTSNIMSIPNQIRITTSADKVNPEPTVASKQSFYSFKSSNVLSSEFGQSLSKQDAFSSASGKNLTISSCALTAAHKLLQEVLDDDHELKTKQGISANKNVSFKTPYALNASSSKTFPNEDIEIDSALFEKMFEDNSFDERDFSPTENVVKEREKILSESENKKDLVSKRRKSLGGRRSMRYSDKL